MKKILVAFVFGLLSLTAFAEATFEQIEGLIQQQNYSAAAAGLEVIIQNHPKSAKAFYAMAQAQAGMGNLEKAKKALDIATGLNPTLDFAPSSSVASLKQAITPQVKKIEAVDESHALRNFILFAMFAGFFAACYFLYSVYTRKQEQEQAARDLAEAELKAERDRERERMRQERVAREAEEAAKEAAIKSHKNYGHERFDPENPDKLKTVKRMKEEAAEKQRLFLEAQERREAQARADAAEASARMYRTSAQTVAQPTTTVVNNGSSGDFVTGMLVGNMLSGSHHDHTTVIERETVREVPAPSRSSSWDDTPAPTPSRSSSWDDDSSSSSSKSSSSWSSSSDDSSSSSWSSSSDGGSSWSDSSSSSSSDW